LKDRLGNAIVLVLVVEFFQQALCLHGGRGVGTRPARGGHWAVPSFALNPALPHESDA
jgi:hypothetical protein